MTAEPLDLDAIRARVDATTAGPWEARMDEVRAAEIPATSKKCRRESFWLADTLGDEDATFIAHARTDIPALLAEVERLRAGIADIIPLTDHTHTGDERWTPDGSLCDRCAKVNALLANGATR